MNEVSQLTVPFHGNALYIIEHNGQPYVPMKPIVEGMGLAWQTQHRKFSENLKRWGITILMIPTTSGIQEMLCLPLRKLFGWLMTISPNKVKAQSKDAIIMYQNECDDVLWNYWTKKASKRQQAHDELNQLYLEEQISQAKGSFHGLGLWKRKKEKLLLKSKIRCCELYLQPSLLPDN